MSLFTAFTGQYPQLFILMSGILGAIMGSFLGVVAERVPAALLRDEEILPGLLHPPSHCPLCQQKLTWWQNIPLLGWCLLGGRCAHCRVPIPFRLLLVELLSMIFFAVTAWAFPLPAHFLLLWTLWCGLMPLTLIDARYMLLPDCLTQPLLWGGLIFNALTARLPLVDALSGAVAGYLTLWLLYWLFRLVTRREGLGYGDFKLLAALGAWLGWQALPPLLLGASLMAILLMLVTNRCRTQQAIPFGPALSTAALSLAVMQTAQILL